MSWLYKVGLGLLVLVGSFASGYLYRGATPPQVITQIEEKIVEKVVIKTVKVTENRPDGSSTTTETTETQEDSTQVTDTSTPSQPVPNVHSGVYLPQYSVGVNWTPRLSEDAFKPTGMEVGYRVLGNMWGTAGFDWRTKEATVGVRVDF